MSETDPVERDMMRLLQQNGIAFLRPEKDKASKVKLDFYLPQFGLYVEVKQFHTPRIADQLAQVPADQSVMVLVGRESVQDFANFCAAVRCS